MLQFIPYFSEEAQIEREMKDLNARRTGSSNRTGAWNWQDEIGAFLGNTSRERVVQGAIDRKNQELREAYAPQVSTDVGALKPRFDGKVAGRSTAELDAQIAEDRRRAAALASAVSDPRFNSTVLSPNAGVSEITSAHAAAIQADNDKKKADSLTETKRQEGRQEGAESRQAARELGIEERARTQRNHELAMQRLDNKEARLRDAENNALQLQLEYARLNQRDLENRRDKKEKQLLMLLQGLGNLGAGFAI